MTLSSDPLEALKWAMNHSGDAWWFIGAIAAGVAWTSNRLRDWRRRNALAINRGRLSPARSTRGASAPSPAAVQPAAGSAYTAAPSYAASAYAAQPAYAAQVPRAPGAAASAVRKLQRETAGAPRAATPFARAADVPASGGWSLGGAFGDPAHARTSIVIAEVLGPPVALR